MAEFFNAQTEKSVLNGLLQDETSLEYGINLLNIDDFYVESHKYLFEIIVRFYHKFFKPINREILIKWLTKNDPNRKSEILLLFGEIKALPLDEYLRFYIDELTSLAAKRRLYSVYKIIQTGLEDDTDPVKIYSGITTDILKGNTITNVSRKWIFDDPEERIQSYIDRRDHPEKYKGVAYNIKSLDDITGGMFPQQLYLIIGRTGMGKSRFLFNIACNAAKAGKNVMYCTIEMELKMIQQMWESREAQISLTRILQQQLTPADEERYFKFLRDQAQIQHPFYIVDIPQGCTTGIIEAEVNTFRKIHGKVPDIVLIDYANLIEPVSKYRDRTEKFDHVFRELKEATRANNTIYYTAAQMNRESLKAKKAGTEHVAFSDASTHHCDGIYHIHSDEKDEINQEVHIDVIKGRFHKKSQVSLSWARDTNHIRDWDDLVRRAPSAPQNTDAAGNQSSSTATQSSNDDADY
jgi:replicative DNA helicase